ncbi:hypothetical protein E3P86_02546 [Wallemia ichthyophaga]|uniref:Uncharacterized protein n=1 Tax=Wallemia ichthyophaga TaxID=245174 RepID=A0A4T0J0R5_WALIC|nr:hypothetical protein E3P86_02546 [Wallemia ichthyophaga]
MSKNPPSPISEPSEPGGNLLSLSELSGLRAVLDDKHGDAPFLYATSLKLLNHAIESSNTLSKQSIHTNNNIDKIELESLKRQAEALSWKLERSRWDARLTRWEAHDEIEPQGTSVLHQDIQSENRMLVGDKRVLENKLEEALRRANRLENELRQIRATLITKAHPGIEAWKDAAWHDGDGSRSDQYGMGDARAEHLLLASKRLNTLIRKSNNPEEQSSLQPKQISRRKAMHSASSSTPKQQQHNGIENLINAATSVFDNQHGRSVSRSPTKPRPYSPSPQTSPKRRRLPAINTISNSTDRKNYVTGGENRNEDPYLHYNSSPTKPTTQMKEQQQDNKGSALDFLADHAVEQSNNETPTSSYALPPKLNALEKDREHINELGPPLRLRGSSPPTPSSPVESPTKKRLTWGTPKTDASSPRVKTEPGVGMSGLGVSATPPMPQQAVVHPQQGAGVQSVQEGQTPQIQHTQLTKHTQNTPQPPPSIVAPHPMQQHPSHHPSAAFSIPPAGFTSMRPVGPSNNSRAPYTKWTGAEDALLAKAVSIHGQKWDAVSKMVGTRSYHQVRQRYLRKSGQNGTGGKLGQHNTRNSNSNNTSYDRDDREDEDDESMDYSNHSTPQPNANAGGSSHNTPASHRPNTRANSPSRKEVFANSVKASKFPEKEGQEEIPPDPIRAREPSLPLTEHHTVKGVSGHELGSDTRRVLIAYDESAESIGALEYYLENLTQSGDHLFLVTILKPLERHLDYSIYVGVDEAKTDGAAIDPRINAFFRDRQVALDKLKLRREEVTATLQEQKKGIEMTIHVAHGDPKSTIPRVCNYHHVNLVIVGRRILGKWKKLFSESVSSAVIEQTKLPVLVVQ